MEQIFAYVTDNWINWMFTIISIIAAAGYRTILREQKKEKEKNTAIAEGMQAILRDRIIFSYNNHKDKGYCPIYAKENVRRMYSAYHALGGNDVATKLKDGLLDMPTESEE